MKSPDEYVVVFITAGNINEAEKLASALVEERLAACVNIVPGCRSVYKWEGKLVKDDEILIVVKTARRLFENLEKRITALHSYDVPEVVAVDLTCISDGYKKFLSDSLS
jgi:periplasmic divalent cation tolerance protein